MSVSPITLQMNVNMTNDVAQTQNNQNMRAATEHMQVAQENEKQVKANSEMVIPKDTLEFSEYQYDAKEEGNNKYFNNRNNSNKKKQQDTEEEKEAEMSRDSKKQLVRIDIKL